MTVGYAGAGGDDKGAVGALEFGADGFNGVPVDLAVLCEFGEVVNEGGVDDRVRLGCSAAQAFEVFKVPAMHLCAGGGESVGARIAARQAEDPMARLNEFRNECGTDETCGAGEEYTHGEFSFHSIHGLDS